MKKMIILLLIIAAAYPYASKYYMTYLAHGDSVLSSADNIDDLVQDLNKALPMKQGLIVYNHVDKSAGSIIYQVTDDFLASTSLSRQDATDRINTWRPFLIDRTCRNPTLSNALKKGITNNVYYQLRIEGGLVDYGSIVVSPEMC